MEKKDPPSGVVTRTSASKVTVAFEAGVEELEASSNQVDCCKKVSDLNLRLRSHLDWSNLPMMLRTSV